MREIQSPHPLDGPHPWVFLAGSIDDGRAEAWQAHVVEALADAPGTLLNPRRDDWDSSWEQSIDDPCFRRAARLQKLIDILTPEQRKAVAADLRAGKAEPPGTVDAE